MKRGLLLFAHGARDARWSKPFEEVAARVRTRAPGVPVELGYLEFMTPGLLEAGQRLASADCRRVNVVPLFLGAGGHVRNDIPELMQQLQTAHPATHWQLRPAIGELPAVIAAMADASLAFLDDASSDC